MGVLYARVGGAWQPVNFSASDRWNNAWGVVAVGAMLEAQSGTAFAAGANISTVITFAGVAGRRYRVRAAVRAIALTTGTGGMWIRFVIDNTAGLWDMHQYSSGQWQSIVMEAPFVGDGVAHTYQVQTAQAATMHFGPTSFFYIEDVGPVAGAVAIPNPTPAWIAPTLQNGWVSYGLQAPQYRMVGDIVYLRGAIKNGSAWGTIAFTLPAGYWPPATLYASTLSAGPSLGYFTVNTLGQVSPQGGSTAQFELAYNFSVTP